MTTEAGGDNRRAGLAFGAPEPVISGMGHGTPDVTRIHGALADSHARLRARDREIVRTQVAVSEIAAPTGAESERGRWIANRLSRLGLADLRTDTVGNVIARRPGQAASAPVVVCAHLDTVFPHGTEVRVRSEDDRLVGPGIGDNGRGLAVLLALAEELDGVRLRTGRPVDFVATVGEEGRGDLRGAKHLFGGSHRDAHVVIALDGAGDERVVHRALGSRRYRLTYRGPGGHSWAAHGVPNPVHAIAAAAGRLAALIVPREPRSTVTVGRIGGGISVNAIPRDGWLEVDVRSTSSAVLSRLDGEVRHAALASEREENARRAPGTPALSHTLELIGDRPSGETAADDAIVVAAMEATRLFGREPELSTASTDANVPIGLGIPAIAIGGGGRGGDSHTPGEWFENADGSSGIARALTIVVAAAGLA